MKENSQFRGWRSNVADQDFIWEFDEDKVWEDMQLVAQCDYLITLVESVDFIGDHPSGAKTSDDNIVSIHSTHDYQSGTLKGVVHRVVGLQPGNATITVSIYKDGSGYISKYYDVTVDKYHSVNVIKEY